MQHIAANATNSYLLVKDVIHHCLQPLVPASIHTMSRSISRKIEYGCTCTAVRPVLCSTSSSVSHSDENHVSTSYSRRLMTFMITFLLPLPKPIQFSGADAWAAAE
ncbi:hypothetical protein HanRHA438_Chr13g0598841 [Helianthus annuus]|nr:hypothetical protein HanRHA438_Chr13g0598841 [Helianthus annuus]